MKKFSLFPSLFSVLSLIIVFQISGVRHAQACTGITLRTTGNDVVAARTIEWAVDPLNTGYVVVPRGHWQQSFTPEGQQNGKRFRAKYGYVGLTVEQPEFVMDGINEAGLAAGLFYFPAYGGYEEYNAADREQSISDFQLVAWILSSFSTINEVMAALPSVHVIGIDPRSSTVHWRITEPSGRQVVLEIVNRQPYFYENTLGVLTNAPGFEWHLTNLNNYINLMTGTIQTRQIGDLTLTAFGGGGGLHGIPGDMTPPSRFVRAAFFQASAPKLKTTEETVNQAFHILNNFDIPIGIQVAQGQIAPDMPSATQLTVATDLTRRRIYYRTMYNATIRCIDLTKIDFRKVQYKAAPLDKTKVQPVEIVNVGAEVTPWLR